MIETFRVGITRDFLKPDGSLGFGDIGLDVLETEPHIESEFLAVNASELKPEHVRGYDAILVLAPRVTADTLRETKRLVLIARFGVGYDNVDVESCTQNDVIVSITPDGVRRPMAASVMTLLLALAHKLLIKDRLIRAGRWAEKLDHMGTGLGGRVLGLLGLGNIGREVFELARPFGLRHVAHDPYVSRQEAQRQGVEWMQLEELLKLADFVCICCALTRETYHLISAERIALMKPTAYLINVARGPIVDQKALVEALKEKRIAGAGLDVFEQEPIDPRDPLLALENVILTPHAICWTDECFRGNGRSACWSILEVAQGRVPRHVVNPAVLERPGLKQKLERYRDWRKKHAD